MLVLLDDFWIYRDPGTINTPSCVVHKGLAIELRLFSQKGGCSGGGIDQPLISHRNKFDKLSKER